MADCSKEQLKQTKSDEQAQMGEEPVERPEHDCLEMHDYARALAETVRRAPMPFTVALQGEWGCGKTSLMNLMRHELCHADSENTKEKFHGIWIESWEYALLQSGDSTQLKVITKILDEIYAVTMPAPLRWMRSFWRWLKGFWLSRLVVAALNIGTMRLIPDSGGANVFNTFLAYDGDSGSAKELRKRLETTIDKYLKKNKDKGFKGFIFFIDDLDRIEPPVAVKILELLKNLFIVKNCVFILAIDYEVVARGLRAKFGEYVSKDSHEFRQFFDKIIQLPFPMPVQKYQSKDLLKTLLEETKYYISRKDKDLDEELKSKDLDEELNPDERSALRRVVLDDARRSPKQKWTPKLTVQDMLEQMVRLSTGQNPRSIKRIVNALSLINIMDEQEAEGQEPQSKPMDSIERRMCFGVVCVQIAYPKIYELLLAQPHFKNWDDEFARKQGLLRAGPDYKNWDNDFSRKHELARAGEDGNAVSGWEQVLALAMQGQAQEGRKSSIAELLRLIAACAECNGRPLGAAMAKILKLATVTGGEADEQMVKLERKEFLTMLEYNEGKSEANVARDFLKILDDYFIKGNNPLLQFAYNNQGMLEARIVHVPEGGDRQLLLFTVKKTDTDKTYSIPAIQEVGWEWNIMEVYELDFQKDGLWKRLLDGYDKRADMKHQLQLDEEKVRTIRAKILSPQSEGNTQEGGG